MNIRGKEEDMEGVGKVPVLFILSVRDSRYRTGIFTASSLSLACSDL